MARKVKHIKMKFLSLFLQKIRQNSFLTRKCHEGLIWSTRFARITCKFSSIFSHMIWARDIFDDVFKTSKSAPISVLTAEWCFQIMHEI